MSEWKEYRIGEICETQTGPFGSQLHNEDYVAVGTPIVTVEHLGCKNFTTQNLPFVSDEDSKRLSKYTLKEGNLVFSRVGSVDRCSYVSAPYDGWLFSGRCLRVRPKDNDVLDSQFLYYHFSNEKVKTFIRNIAFGATMPSINTKLLNEVPISLPSLSEQKKIADILSSLDEKIETNRKINARLEELAQANFKSWFIDFEPFGGKMPEDWQTGALSNIAQIIMGQSPSGESINNQQEGMIFYQGKSEFGERFPSVKNYTSNITRIAPQNSILLSVRAPVGDVNITLNQCCIGRGIASINYKDGSNSYLYLLLKSKSDYFDIFDNGGTVFGSINKKGLEEMPIIIPSSPTIKEFNEIISPIDKEIERRYNESTRLASLRDTLLPKLMSGELIPE